MTQEISYEGVERLPLAQFSEKAYLDYSMYVILDRALPHVEDGLKPVQRRIVYAMSELGLKASAKYKKSARTVGDVLGKYHPHGDMACYEAMVLMAQPFSYRYPLVDGQGNWGSPDDPKSFAAMRYTESRLTPYAEVLLSELEQGTVDWVPNFDATLDEPSLLPARLPNILLNGTTGIAVGMATDIPPHNLREVAAACVRLLDQPETTVDELCEHVLGPDYPTSAEIITSAEDIRRIYEQGTGSIRMRARYEMEEGDIIITALPHQASPAKVLEQIAAQMNAKKLPMVQDLRDESDHESPIRLVIVPRSNRVDIEPLMSHLFATTDLERSYRVNLNMIGIDGRPQVKDLRTILTEWLSYRTTTVRRRLQHRLDKVLARLHILDGLLIAFLNIDEVIAIIRQEDEPKPVLMSRFGLTDIQAEAILDLKLRHLAKLEEFKIRGEQAELAKERDHLQGILADRSKLNQLLRDEILADAEKYGDQRRSPLVSRIAAQALSETALVGAEPITVVLSEKGWVRAAKGHDIDPSGLNYKSGDSFLAAVPGKTNQSVVFLDSNGRGYALPGHGLPSARGQGEPLTGHFNPPEGGQFVSLMMGSEEQHFLMFTDAGYGFVAKYADLVGKNKTGKSILSVPTGAHVQRPQVLSNVQTDQIAVVTLEGRLLVFPASDLPILSKGKGVKLVGISGSKLESREDYVTGLVVLPEHGSLLIRAGQRRFTLKPADITHYQGERGKRGSLLPRGLQRVDEILVVPE